MQIEGNPVRVNIGKNVTVTEKKTGEKIGATVTDILDDLIILKRKKDTRQNYGSGKMPLRKIKFEPNERNISNILNGVDSLDTDHLKVLFPVNELPEFDVKSSSISKRLHGESDLNVEQDRVVSQIMKKSSPHPFILFGPPGTGKTRTICEAIKQLYFRNKLFESRFCHRLFIFKMWDLKLSNKLST